MHKKEVKDIREFACREDQNTNALKCIQLCCASSLIPTNLAEKIAMTVTESPYRVTADIISSTCGQGISAGGEWNLMQRLGERISDGMVHLLCS